MGDKSFRLDDIILTKEGIEGKIFGEQALFKRITKKQDRTFLSLFGISKDKDNCECEDYKCDCEPVCTCQEYKSCNHCDCNNYCACEEVDCGYDVDSSNCACYDYESSG
mgnify:CR=1 FL=1